MATAVGSEKTMQEQLTEGEIAVVRIIGGCEDRQLAKAGITAQELEEQIRDTIGESEPLLKSLTEKRLIVLNGDTEEEYPTRRFRLTGRGQHRYLHLPFPGSQPATPEVQPRDRYTVFDKTLEFRECEILCNDKDTGIRKDDSKTVLRRLCENPGHVVPFKSLLPEAQDGENEAQQPLRDAVCHLKKKLAPFGLRVENIRGSGYKMTTE